MLFVKTYQVHNLGTLGGILWHWEELIVRSPVPPHKAAAHHLSPEPVP